MEGRSLLSCADCGRTREISGEMPEEYAATFAHFAAEEGWVPKPGPAPAMICGACASAFAGHETVDDEPKVRGDADPKGV